MSALIRATLSAQSVKLQPGERAELTLTVQNFSDIVDRYRIAVEGIEPAWVALSRSELSLFPKDQDQVRLTVSPPAGAAARAGSYDVRVQVTSLESPSERTTMPLALEIAAQGAFEATLRPQMQSGLREGVYSFQLSNGGNTDITVQPQAMDPEEGCTYTFEPPRATLPAGQERLVQLTVRPKVPRAPKGGKTYSFTITARPEELPQQARQVPGQWQHLAPKRSIWPLLIAAAGGLLALVVLAVFVVVPLIGSIRAPAPTERIAMATAVSPRPTTAVPEPSSTPAPTTARPLVPSLPVVPPVVTLRPIRPSIGPILRPTTVPALDLVASAGAARWINEEGTVLGFGDYSEAVGSVLYGIDVILENGRQYSRVLATIPRLADGSGIQGDFSAKPYAVNAGDELVIEAGLAATAKGSDGVRFRVLLMEQNPVLLSGALRGGGGTTLWDVVDTYDGSLVSARVSLDQWAGKTVWFLIQAQANGSADSDVAVWTVFQVE